ncbi:hypothetical protein D3C85_1525900 [compost metagenome]
MRLVQDNPVLPRAGAGLKGKLLQNGHNGLGGIDEMAQLPDLLIVADGRISLQRIHAACQLVDIVVHLLGQELQMIQVGCLNLTGNDADILAVRQSVEYKRDRNEREKNRNHFNK